LIFRSQLAGTTRFNRFVSVSGSSSGASYRRESLIVGEAYEGPQGKPAPELLALDAATANRGGTQMADPIIKISNAILQADAVILDEQAEHVVLTMWIPKETCGRIPVCCGACSTW
jgi:hypothetical protein